MSQFDSFAKRAERWHNDPDYHARVAIVRCWMERSQGAAPEELLSYAMDVVADLEARQQREADALAEREQVR